MSRSVQVEWAETAEELYARYRRQRDVAARKRLHALWLVRRGDAVASAAQQAGVGTRTLERWLRWYREGGLSSVLGRVPGHGARGAAGKLTTEQVAQLAQHAGSGAFHTYGEAAEWVRSAYGVAYSYNGIWSLLTKLEIRPKVPRPVAEKAKPQAQEAFKRGGLPPH